MVEYRQQVLLDMAVRVKLIVLLSCIRRLLLSR
jgi:hypothetical protein